jgi:hypothetical protein
MKRLYEEQLLKEEQERESQMRSAGLTQETIERLNAYIRNAQQEKKND